METLAQLQLEPAAERGPDVVHRIAIPTRWLRHGATIECELPRRLHCAACDGGGCDRCARSGVVLMAGADELGRKVVVQLARDTPSPCALRVLDAGGAHPDPHVARGYLLLQVCEGKPPPGVRLLGLNSGRPQVSPSVILALLAAVVAFSVAWCSAR